MSNNETRISNERLAEMLADIGKCQPFGMMSYGPGDIASLREALSELQALRSTPVEANHIDAAIRLTKQIEGVFYHDHPGGAVQVRAKVQLILVEALAHPLPNPSPSDGEVSLPRLTDELIYAAAVGHYGKSRVDRSGGPRGIAMTVDGEDLNFHAAFKRMWAGVRRSLQSKRGQP